MVNLIIEEEVTEKKKFIYLVFLIFLLLRG